MDGAECRSSRGMRMDGRMDGRSSASLKGCTEWKGMLADPDGVAPTGLQPHRRLYAPDGYRSATRVVAKGGATSIGGLLPVALVVLLTEGWIGAWFHARRSTWTACDAATRARILCSCVRHFLSRLFLDSRNWHRDSWLLRFRGVRKRSLIVTIFNWKLFCEKLYVFAAIVRRKPLTMQISYKFPERIRHLFPICCSFNAFVIICIFLLFLYL